MAVIIVDTFNIYHKLRHFWIYGLVALVVFGLAAMLLSTDVLALFGSTATDKNRVITIYDDNTEKTVVSHADTIRDALKDAEISVSSYDSVSPSVDTQIKDSMVIISIHRARPIVIVDGNRKVRVITSAQSMSDIAKAAGIKIYAEDRTSLGLIQDILAGGGAGLQLNIERAKVINLRLYGQDLLVRTQAATIGDFLKEKKINLGSEDGIDHALDDRITNQMNLRIWRNGIQTITATEDIAFTTKTVKDPTRKVGYREVQVKGQNGQKTVIYQIETRDGQEISRTKISEVVNSDSVEQVEIVGTKSTGGLTKSKGVNQFTDSNGVTHRETYYDLPMSVVMKYCGGGSYMIREDGAKVDKDGYILVAASLSRYPRCSVVETSIGLGKVYDTGGFVSRYPDGFDLATDWSNYDGR